MEDTNKKSSGLLNNNGVLAVIMTIIVVIGIFGGFGFYHYMLQHQVFLERQAHIIEMTNRASQIANTVTDTSWQMVDICKNYFLTYDEQKGSMHAVREIQSFINKESHVVFAFDEDMKFYSSDGVTGDWQGMIGDTAENQIFISALPYDTGETYMIFVESLDTPKTMVSEEKKITHIAVAVDFTYLNAVMAIESYPDISMACAVDGNGNILYTYNHSVPIDGDNIIDAMKEQEFLNGGNVDDLALNFKEQSSGGYEVNYNGANYFVSSSAVSYNDWSVLLLVPSDAIGARTSEFTDFMDMVILYFVIMSTIMLLLFCAAVYILTKNKSSKEMLRHQEEVNASLMEEATINKRANDAKSEFLTHMSHDIRTPINGIMGMTDIALKNIDNSERVADCLNKIQGSSKHLLSLVNDVLDMSRIESGKTKANREQMDILQIAQNCASIIGGQLSGRDINFVTDFDDFRNSALVGDELHLRQVLINILGNSVKFTPDGGSIFFRIHEQGEQDGKARFRIEVEDTGIGMKPEFLEHIWEPFSQEDDGSRTHYKGTGLGMAITKKFVELMGGTIDVESKLNEGTKFTIEIAFDIDYSGQVCEIPWAKKDFTGTKVMLVEDNELNMEIAQILLEEEGIVVTTAENGKVAADKFAASKEGDFDVILMDVMMPVMDGLEATRTIRAMERPDAAAIPIIAMTANAFEDDIKKTKEAGMNEHLSKPMEMSAVLRMLGKYL